MPQGISIHIGVNRARADCCGRGPLPEAENDARRMADIARKQDFDVMGPLLTAGATRKNVQRAMHTAAKALGNGDMLLLTYAGHGCRVYDRPPRDDRDRFDETWCLPDAQFTDDQLRQLLADFEDGVRILLISDSCHSGSLLARFADGHLEPVSPTKLAELGRELAPARTFRPPVAPRCESPPLIRDLRLPPEESTINIRASVLFISACSEAKEAEDGLFTSELEKLWAQGRFQGTYVEFIWQLHNLVSGRKPDQKPGWACDGAFDPAFLHQRPFTI